MRSGQEECLEEGADETQPEWWNRLAENLSRLYDELRHERFPNEAELQDPAQLAAQELDEIDRDIPPWNQVSQEEEDEYAEAMGGALRRDLQVALELTPRQRGVSSDARAALVRLVAWDHRHLRAPLAVLALRQAQVANDRPFLKAIGNAVAENVRYGGRVSRSQFFLNRILIQLRFGDRNAYDNLAWRKRVYDGLLDAFNSAGVPETNPAMNLLQSPDNFAKHVRRLKAQ